MKNIILGIFCFTCLSCATSREAVRYPPERWLRDNDQQAIQKPKIIGNYPYWKMVDQGLLQPFVHSMDLSEQVVFEEAQDVNNFDEVPDSTWFTNRIGRHGSAAVREALRMSGPDDASSWDILEAKIYGSIHGVLIQDRRGERYLLKFDDPSYPELATGAEAISTRVFRAVGYHVPDSQIVWFDPQKLRLRPDATRHDRYGRVRSFTAEDLEKFLDNTARMKTGRYRAIAIRLPAGDPLGPFSFKGRRRGDPNDRIRHQQRRALRGLRVFSSFLNHRDIGESNTLDVFEKFPRSEHGFLRHYLIDFDETLGSGGKSPMAKEHLYDYQLNDKRVLVSLALLGRYHPFWEQLGEPEFPETGRLESKLYKAQTWKPSFSNAAFSQITKRDGFWATKILMKFSDADIEAIVREAHYSRPEVARLVAKILKERRDKAGLYWFQKINPLDDFELHEEKGVTAIDFHDLAVNYGFEKSENTSYQYHLVNAHNGKSLTNAETTLRPKLIIPPEHLALLKPNHPYFLRIETIRSTRTVPLPPLDVIIMKNNPISPGEPLKNSRCKAPANPRLRRTSEYVAGRGCSGQRSRWRVFRGSLQLLGLKRR